MASRSLEQLARESIDAFNRSDWSAVRALAVPDYVYEEVGTGRRCEGIEETLTALQGWKAAIPDGSGEVQRVVVDGDVTVLEVDWRGTQTGPLAAGGASLPASGRSFEIRSAIWSRWRGEQMVEQRHYIDALGLLTQLGAIPAPAEATRLS